MKKLMLMLGIFLCFSLYGGSKKKNNDYQSIVKESKLKKYNPNAVWKKVSCKHCNGTGHKIKQKYDAKHNRMIKWLIPCPYCHGKGTAGMSKM